MLKKTDTTNPDYYHRVVDCQWACPAHTDVPEYIRLIKQERYTEAYLVNRESNVFPGILGRVCDRPCEPACRRSRVEKEAVAICRLKRVAADHRGDISEFLPKAPKKLNGKKIALIGAGPASLVVANDLIPLGYDCHLFEKMARPGGAMRTSVPLFRLPEKVLDEEIAMIIDGGVKTFYNHEVKSLKGLLDKFDAVFIGSGAPIGKDLQVPGRQEAGEAVKIGLNWLASVAFGHEKKLGARVLVIGGGNTAMDCCRTALRFGGKEVSVIAPESFDEMLASPWEKDDAIDEKIKITNHLLPKEFILKQGRLEGVRFQVLKQCYDSNKKWAPVPSGEPDVILPCDDVILAIGQNTAYPYIEKDAGVEFNEGQRPIVDPKTLQSTNPKVFFGGDAAFGPKNIIWAVAHGHDAAISIHKILQKKAVTERPTPTMTLTSQKMGFHDWSYDQAYSYDKRHLVPHEKFEKRIKEIALEVELGFDQKQALEEADRCLNCDVQTVFSEKQCIECDACVDICPLQCLTIAENRGDKATAFSAPLLHFPEQSVFVSDPLVQTGRVMFKDEDLCIHCGLCAERCPTAAWDMQTLSLHLPKAQEL